MRAVSIPSKFPIPFAADAGSSYINPIPEASLIGIKDGAASLTDGFPPKTFLPVPPNGTGVPPFGQDFNGILNQISAWAQWQSAGGPVGYDATFSAAIGGYPQGAILAAAKFGSYWLSTIDNNTSDPDTGGANWLDLSQVLTATFANVATVESANISATVRLIRTQCYSVFPKGGAQYYRLGSAPGSPKPWQIQSGDGAWWQLNERFVLPEMFNAMGDGSTDDTAAVQAWFDYGIAQLPGQCLLNRLSYFCASTMTINGPVDGSFGNNNVSYFGSGFESNIMAYGAPGIHVTGSVNFMVFSNFRISGLQGGTNNVLAMDSIFGNFVLQTLAFTGGGNQIYMTSTNLSTGGTLAVHADHCQFLYSSNAAILSNPQETNLVENIHLTGCEFDGHATYGLFINGADAIYMANCRLERPGIFGTAKAAIHIDSTFQVVMRDCYIEDGNNVPLLELGSSVYNVGLEGDLLSVNVSGSSGFNNASAVTTTVSAFINNVPEVWINHCVAFSQGSINVMFSLSGTNIERRFNTIRCASTNYGFNDNGSPQARIDSDFNVFQGTYNTTKTTSIEGAGRAKAWCVYNGSTNTILASSGISSVTKNGTGDYTFNFETSMKSSNPTVTVSGASLTNGTNVCVPMLFSVTPGTARVQMQVTGNATGGTVDSTLISIEVNGEVTY